MDDSVSPEVDQAALVAWLHICHCVGIPDEAGLTYAASYVTCNLFSMAVQQMHGVGQSEGMIRSANLMLKRRGLPYRLVAPS
jgi:hypothetical protein